MAGTQRDEISAKKCAHARKRRVRRHYRNGVRITSSLASAERVNAAGTLETNAMRRALNHERRHNQSICRVGGAANITRCVDARSSVIGGRKGHARMCIVVEGVRTSLQC